MKVEKTTEKPKSKGFITVMILLLGALIIALSIDGERIHYFNSREMVQKGSSKYVSLDIHERGGKADSWVKKMGGTSPSCVGNTYDCVISNLMPYDISQWNMRINIKENVYLNSAWCGTVEIHQKNGGQEKVQTLNLRAYKEDWIKLEHKVVGGDLLIPLSPGDYIIYYPNVSESHMQGADKKDSEDLIIGAIFYTQKGDPLDMSDSVLTYRFKENPLEVNSFRLIIILLAAWLAVFFIYIYIEWRMKAASEKMANDEQIIDEEFGVFSKFFDAKDPSTSGHSSRVAEYSKLIAQKMGRNADECRQIYYIALMHDTGKVRTPDSILKKPGKLTPEEYDIIKLHTTDGASILSDFRSIESIRDGALYHHERYDGNGYPTGRSGLDIPFIGRLICVADSFDAMNSRRCYRSRLSRDKIISEIKDNRGTQFDPDIADALLSLIDEKVITIDECNE